jgi:hypothetical protein
VGSDVRDDKALTEIYFQRQPCLRVSPPKPGPMGRRHRDRDYGRF